MAPIVVPQDAYFMLGDNRIKSKDSRFPDVGCIAETKIKGKVVFRLFPISNAGGLY
jgi:signal peptidase I